MQSRDSTSSLQGPGCAPTAPMYDPRAFSDRQAPRELRTNTAPPHQPTGGLRRDVIRDNRLTPPHSYTVDAEETDNEQRRHSPTPDARPSPSKRQRRGAVPMHPDDEELQSFKKNQSVINEIIANLSAQPEDWMRHEMLPKRDGKIIPANEWCHSVLVSMVSLSRLGAGKLPLVRDALWNAFKDPMRKRRNKYIVAQDVIRAEEELRGVGSASSARETKGNIAHYANELGLRSSGGRPTRSPSFTSSRSATTGGDDRRQIDGNRRNIQQHEASTIAVNSNPIQPAQRQAMEGHTPHTSVRPSRTPRPEVRHDMQHNSLPDQDLILRTTEAAAADGSTLPSLPAQNDIPANPIRDPVENLRLRPENTTRHDAGSGSSHSVRVRWNPDDDVDIDLTGGVLVAKRKANEHSE